jgi:hypothetical protein
MPKAAESAKEKQFKNPGLIDVAKMDELKQLGWRTENLGSGYSAYEISGDRKIGPFDSLADLSKEVKATIGNKFELPKDEPVLEHMTADSKGNTYLPGHGPRVIPELAQAVTNYHNIKMQRVDLTAKEVEAKQTLSALLHKHEEHLEVDKDGAKCYVAGDVKAKLVTEEKETVKTEPADKEE